MIHVLRAGKRYAQRLMDGTEKAHEAAVRQRLKALEGLPPIRVAIAGAGQHAVKHLEILAAMPNVELAGVSNRGRSDLSWIQQQFPVKATFGDYRRMLDEAKPDAVFIVVSHEETVSVTLDCLRRGIACMVEKPAGFASGETEGLAEAAERSGVFNMVALNRRYLSSLQYALGAILSRGPIRGIFIEAPELLARARNEGRFDESLYKAWLVANSIHAIDLFRCVGGEVTELIARKTCLAEEGGDGFSAILSLTKGNMGTFVAHWDTAGHWRLQLYGTGIRANLDLYRGGDLQFANGRSQPIRVDPIDIKHKPGMYAQNEAFVTAVATGERPAWPASDLRDQVATMKLIEAINAA